MSDLPPGNLWHLRARNAHRGNVNNQALKEYFLTVRGDPEISAVWLANQIEALETRTGEEASRQRAGARFDTARGPVLAAVDSEEESENEDQGHKDASAAPAPSSKSSYSRPRSRSSRGSHARTMTVRRKTRSKSPARRQTGEPSRAEVHSSVDPLNFFSPDAEDPLNLASATEPRTAEPAPAPRQEPATEEEFARLYNAYCGAVEKLNSMMPPSPAKKEEPSPAAAVSDVDYDPFGPWTPAEAAPSLGSNCPPEAASPGGPYSPTEAVPSPRSPTPVPNLECQEIVLYKAPLQIQEEEDDVSVSSQHNSSWDNFYETAQAALLETRACANWRTNPYNLADVLKSIDLQIQKLQSGPPEVANAWESNQLEEVTFCICSFKREEQLKKALPLNLACLAPYRHQVRVVVVTFGPDTTLQEWLRSKLGWAVEGGWLQLASGGTASGTALPADVGSWIHRAGVAFDAWHASVAKNSSHLVALMTSKKDLSKTLLVNLDNDNLVGVAYLGAVAEAALTCKNSWHGGACPSVGCGSGSLTGRLAYWALDFCAVFGYDQEPDVCPSGHAYTRHTFFTCMICFIKRDKKKIKIYI